MNDRVHTPLFDRFESDRESGLEELARDVADILGARRAFKCDLPGVPGWGLPDLSGLSPASSRDRERIAEYVAQAIERFEPRLERVNVTPMEDTGDFMFRIDAELLVPEGEPVTLRILCPRLGGGVGAEVVVIEEHEDGSVGDASRAVRHAAGDGR